MRHWLLVLLILGLPALAPAQGLNSCDLFPTCGDAEWRMANGLVLRDVGSRIVDGREGRVFRWSDGEEYVFACGPTGLEMLALEFPFDDCGTVGAELPGAATLLPFGPTAGQSVDYDADLNFECAALGTIPGTITADIDVVEVHDSFTVQGGSFANVVEVRLRATLSSLGVSIPVDWTFWLAEDVGLIKFENPLEAVSTELSSGRVCGEAIQSTFPPPITDDVPVPGLGDYDFRVPGNIAGWLHGYSGEPGGATFHTTDSGLCMTVPGPGVNTALWVSPNNAIPLISGVVYRLRLDFDR